MGVPMTVSGVALLAELEGMAQRGEPNKAPELKSNQIDWDEFHEIFVDLAMPKRGRRAIEIMQERGWKVTK
jgi:hypothetical protein